MKTAAKSVEDAGGIVEETRPPSLERVGAVREKLGPADGRAWVHRLLKKAGTTDVHPWIEERQKDSKPIDTAEYTALLEEVDQVRSEMLSFLQDFDVILCPVSPYAAPPHETWRDKDQFPGISDYTSPYNVTGWPGAVVRAGTSEEGLPIGVQVVSRPWREDVALAVVAHLEVALGGWQRPPI